MVLNFWLSSLYSETSTFGAGSLSGVRIIPEAENELSFFSNGRAVVTKNG